MPDKPPNRHIRTPVEVDRDRRIVSELYLKMMTLRQISEATGLSIMTVSRDLEAVRKRWQREAVRDIGERKMIELARLDKIEAEAWDAWERSKKPRERKETLVEKNDEGDGEKLRTFSKKRTSLVSEEYVGDPRYLAIIQKCIEQRASLIGLNAPVKTENTTGIVIANVAPELVEGLMRTRLPSHTQNDEVIDAKLE